MKNIFYSKDAQFELTDNEYEQSLIAWNKNLKAYIPRLSVSLSPLYIWAGEKPEDNNRKQNRDGQWCIQKFGQWYLESDNSIKVDVRYYPELLEQSEKKELPSSFAKKLSDTVQNIEQSNLS